MNRDAFSEDRRRGLIERIQQLRADTLDELKHIVPLAQQDQTLSLQCADEIETLRDEVAGIAEKLRSVDDGDPATVSY